MKKFLFVLVVMGLVLSSGPVLAKDGFYMGMDLGVAVAPDMDIKTGGFDDWSPAPEQGAEVPGRPMRQDHQPAGSGRRMWRMCPRSRPPGEWVSRLMGARGFWRDWPWGIAWAASGSRGNISIAAPGMVARLNPIFPLAGILTDTIEYN